MIIDESYIITLALNEQQTITIKANDKFYHWRDNDPYYIVGFLKDNDTQLIICKSWSKYKFRWCYNIETSDNLIYSLKSLCQITQDKYNKSNYIIKANKSKE